jgi:hypothetical protein
MGGEGERGRAPRDAGQVHVQGVRGIESMPSSMLSPPRSGFATELTDESPTELAAVSSADSAPTAPPSPPRSDPEAPLPSSLWWWELDGDGGSHRNVAGAVVGDSWPHQANCIEVERKCLTIHFVLPLSSPLVCIA